MATKNKQILASILSNLSKTGRVLGTEALSKPKLNASTPLQAAPLNSFVLTYKSYNPYLDIDNFRDLLSREHQLALNFQLLKARDPKFLQFNDKYHLLFDRPGDLASFLSYTKFSRIGRVRVKFTPLIVGSDEYTQMLENYSMYANNLNRLYEGQTQPAANEAGGNGRILDKIDQKLLTATKSIERKSLLVWNLPKSFDPDEIRDHFWFYDIKRCVELYAGSEDSTSGDTPSTLSFFAFNNVDDCEKFRLNYHGTFFDQANERRLLVEALD